MAEAVVGASVGAGLLGGFKQNQANERAGRALASATKKSNQVERRLAEIRNARSIEEYVNSIRAQSASNIASAAASDVTSSSALSGANASLMATASGRLGFMNTELAANTLKADYLQQGQDKYNTLSNQANNWGTLANTAGSVGQIAGGYL